MDRQRHNRRSAGGSLVLLLLLIGLGLWLAGCSGGPPVTAGARAPLPARWVRFRHVPGVVDLTGPRGDGRLTVAAAGRLSLLSTSGRPAPFARGSGGYTTAVGPEPYIAMPTGKPATGLGCSFGKDATYALEPNGSAGVISIDKQGQARRFASLPGVRPDGITFDDVGRFGHRLLVTATARGGTTVFGVGCAGRVTTIASYAPMESTAFVPAGFSRDWAAYVADRGTPGNRHPGTNSILRLSGKDLARAGIHAGELVVASEGGAQTIVINCSPTTCTIRHIADGPTAAHVEGHIVFAPAPSSPPHR